jgi:hypothetical protein
MFLRYAHPEPDAQLGGLSFKRPFGTRAVWASYPALKRRAILAMSLRDRASRRSWVSIHVRPGQTPELLQRLKLELPPQPPSKIINPKPPSQTNSVVKT